MRYWQLTKVNDMQFRTVISFAPFVNDKPLDIQLEPEAIIYTVGPGEELSFVGISNEDNFKWVVRVSDGGIQLFPDAPSNRYEGIEILKNGTRIPNQAV